VKSATQIIAELDSMYELGWHGHVFFVDANLIGNKHSLKTDLLPALIAWRKMHRHIPFNTEASINLADDEELMNMMVAAGFDSVFIGIETPGEQGLAECSKKQSLRRNLIADVKRLQRTGLQVQAGFIVGFDSDAPSIFQRQIDFIQQSGIVTAMVGLLQAPTGTKPHHRMKSEGRLLSSMSGDNADGTTNIVPRVDIEQLQAGYQRILRHIYSPKQYYARVKTLLREFRPRGDWHWPSFGDFMAFFRSIVRLGIIGRERVQYWSLMLWVLFRRPRLLPEAVTLAIYGYHFRTVCERRLG
jgi:radical SAM superfamily enzyme YgiQ (UPF0313 family)